MSAKIYGIGGADVIQFLQNGVGAVVRTLLSKLQSLSIDPMDFGAVGDGVTDDTVALQAAIDNYKREGLDLSTSSSAAAALAGIAPVVIDLAGKTYKISASLDFADLYYVTFKNGRIIADTSATWGGDFMLYIAKTKATDIARDQKIRNLTFENIVIDGNLVANCVYLENTYEITFKNCIALGWVDDGYGFRTSLGSDTVATKNTHLKLDNVTASQIELATLTSAAIPTSGTAFSIRTADFMLNECTAFAADVAFDIDGQFNGQMVNCHGFVKSAQYCLKLGADAHHISITNFYSDTGLVEIRSFAHTLNGCLFIAGSTVQFVSTLAGEDCSGLVVSGGLFTNQPEYLIDGAGTWATTFKSEWTGNRLTDGSPVRGRGQMVVSRGTAASPAIIFNDDSVASTGTGFYSPAAGETAYSAGGTMAYLNDSSGRIIYGHTASITQIGGSAPKIQMHSTTANNSSLTSVRWNSTAGSSVGGGGQVAVGRSRSGTIGSYAALETGDGLGRYAFFGDNGTDVTKIGGAIRAEASENWAAASSPTNVIIQTVASGSTTATDRLVIEAAGHVRPSVDASYNLGSADYGFQNVYLTGDVYVDDVKVLGSQESGWTASTGTPNKGAYATYAGQTMSAGYVQAEAQTLDDAVKAVSERLKALEDMNRTHGLMN